MAGYKAKSFSSGKQPHRFLSSHQEDYSWPCCLQQSSNAPLTENLLSQAIIYKAHISSRESYSVELEFTSLHFQQN